MMRKLTLLGMIAAVAIVGLSMSGCDNGNSGGGGGMTIVISGIDASAGFHNVTHATLTGRRGSITIRTQHQPVQNGTATFSADWPAPDPGTYGLSLRGMPGTTATRISEITLTSGTNRLRVSEDPEGGDFPILVQQ
jgi:hypothetical protein